jgi:hypothetical protein
MYKCMCIQYIQGLCQSRLSTADHALLLGAPATTVVYSLERSYAWPPTNRYLPMDCWPRIRVRGNAFTGRCLTMLCANPSQYNYMSGRRPPVPKKRRLIYEYNFLLRNITLQHPDALAMVCRGSLDGATSCRACRLPVCYAVTFV